MKPQRVQKYIPCGGVDQRLNAPLGKAKSIVNCRWAEEFGWIGDVGLESWWTFPTNFINQLSPQTYFGSPVDSVYQWKRAGSGDIYTFVEQNGRLYYFLGNKGQGATYSSATLWNKDIVIVEDGRHIPKQTDVGTQYINLGQKLLIINGYDKPILFSGDRVWRTFGFAETSPPALYSVQSNYLSDGQLNGGIAIHFSANDYLGVGNTSAAPQQYSYKMSYISDLGAESPLSSASLVSWDVDQSGTKYKWAVGMQLPYGPEGTVARRIYRTKNIEDSGEVYYLLRQINENASNFYVDYYSDNYLVVNAPSSLASTSISPDYEVGEVWDSRLWLAKGSQIIYSNAGIFEQFGAADYFDVSNLTGGDVTAIRAYYDNLIVFRETAINIISKQSSGYSISTVHATLGTRATNAIVSVPQLGIVFLTDHGIWALSGGLQGGSTVNVNRISHPIDKQLSDLNTAIINRAIGGYSPVDQEVWIHYPQADVNVPSLGAVLHLSPDTPQWSFRADPGQDHSFRFRSMCTTVDGDFLFGTDNYWFDQDGLPSEWNTPGASNASFGPLQVVSRRGLGGQTATINSIVDGVYNYQIVDTPAVGSLWQSAWYNFGDDSAKHRVYSVELEVMSEGDNAFSFFYLKDYNINTETGTTDQKQAKSETVFTLNEPAVYAADADDITKVPFNVGTSQVRDGELIRLRYDVNTELINQFSFGIKGDKNFQLLGFNLLYDTVEIPVLNQATRLQRGQAR